MIEEAATATAENRRLADALTELKQRSTDVINEVTISKQTVESEMITINNDGQKIISTNYWDTKHAASGFLYLSWNAVHLSRGMT